MAKRTYEKPKPLKFTDKNGYDLMGGMKVVTHPATLKAPFVPGTGMGLGMGPRRP